MCNTINESIEWYCIIFIDATVAITTHNILNNNSQSMLFCSVAKVIIHATSNEPRPLIVLLETNPFETVVNGVLVDLISK